MKRKRRAALAALGAGLALLMTESASVSPASASGSGELRAEIRGARKTSEALARKPWNVAAETRLVDRIDRIADHFNELASSGARIPQTANSLMVLIETTRRRYTAKLESMQAEVIRQDGDLEAVQDSKPWKQRELLAARLLYRLNWVRYEIASRYEHSAAKRLTLLRSARDGFAEFLSAGNRELTIDSLLGHGLASKTLKQYDTAIRDFQSALSKNPDPETAVKLRLSLAEIYVTQGRIGNALTETARLDKMRSGALHNQVRFLRAKTLLLAVGRYKKSYNDSRRGQFRSEAATVLERLYGASSYWRGKVVQLIDAGIEDPLEWATATSSPFVKFLIASSLRKRGNCSDAKAMYSALLEQNRYVAESHYGIGFCEFYDGSYQDAIRDLTLYLDGTAKATGFVGQAAYLRFKAAESLYLKDENRGNEVAAQRYVAFMKDFLKRAPQHAYAYEAWFRLGEWYRDKHQWVDAATAFGKVRGDPVVHLKASFQSAQSYFEAVLQQAKHGGTPKENLVKMALTALDRFVDETGKFRDEKTAGKATEGLAVPLIAKAVTMAAGICTHVENGMRERLRRLKGFETRFPDQQDLFAEVSALRIVAYRRLGDLDSAGSELEKLLSTSNAGGYHSDALRKLGVVFLKEAAKRDEAGNPEAAKRARKTALRIYQYLLADMRKHRGNGEKSEAERGIEKLISDLRAQVGT